MYHILVVEDDIDIQELQLDLEINIPDNQIIRADKKLMSKVISNLFSNAIRYSPMSEKITIILSNCNEQIQFKIYNSGIQICDESLPHLFEPFYRAEESRNKKSRW